MLKWNFN